LDQSQSAQQRNDYKTRFGWMKKEAMRAGRVIQVKILPEQRPNNISGCASGRRGMNP
jgi:hypothetical protein